MTRQNHDALIGTHLPNQDKREQLLDLKGNRKSTAKIAKRKPKQDFNPPLPLAIQTVNRQMKQLQIKMTSIKRMIQL